jgi:hypothetical protein
MRAKLLRSIWQHEEEKRWGEEGGGRGIPCVCGGLGLSPRWPGHSCPCSWNCPPFACWCSAGWRCAPWSPWQIVLGPSGPALHPPHALSWPASSCRPPSARMSQPSIQKNSVDTTRGSGCRSSSLARGELGGGRGGEGFWQSFASGW